MGSSLCCAHDRSLYCDTSMSPNLLTMLLVNNRRRMVNHECIHNSNLNYHSEKNVFSNSEMESPVKYFVEKRASISRISRTIEDQTAFSLTESTLTEKEDEEFPKWYRLSQNYQNDWDLKTIGCPREINTVIEQWMISENDEVREFARNIFLNIMLRNSNTGDDIEINECSLNTELTKMSVSKEGEKKSRNMPLTKKMNYDYISPCDSSVVSKLDRGENWLMPKEELSFDNDYSSSSEKVKLNEENTLNFLKSQWKLSRRQSLIMSDVVANLPSLSDVFSEMSRGSLTITKSEKLPLDQLSMVCEEEEIVSNSIREKHEGSGNLEVLLRDIDELSFSIDGKAKKN
jgi:hypothetical protein